MAFIPNKAQEKAIQKTKGPVIVIACPGSGKTTTLVRRIHRMIETGANPKKILMVTFAAQAAQDMARRYEELYKKNPGITFSTIHRLCFSLLIRERGYRTKSVLDERTQIEFFLQRLKNDPTVNDPWETARAIVTEISVIKNNYINIRKYRPRSIDKETFVALYREYEQMKERTRHLDYDDMLVKALEVLEVDKEVRTRWQNRFDYIQCDEYQDTNRIQRDILYLLAAPHNNLCVVGDDDQSIYKFRGADASIMMEFEEDFEQAESIYLSTNYRSTQNIVDIADVCIQRNTVRFPKDFISYRGERGERGHAIYSVQKDKAQELTRVADLIEERKAQGIPYKDMAILFRINRQAMHVVEALERREIPVTLTERAKSVFDHWIYADIKAYMELALGIDTQKNLQRIINRPNRYLRAREFENIEYTQPALIQALRYIQHQGESWQWDKAKEAMVRLWEAFGKGKLLTTSPPSAVYQALDHIGYYEHIKEAAKYKTQGGEDVFDDFNIIRNTAKDHKTIEDWMRYADKKIQAARRRGRDNPEKEGVVIATMHRSKGMEWNSVFVTGVSEGMVPNKNSETKEEIEEERRLLYVAMTRAKDFLHISSTPDESPFMLEIKADREEKKAPPIKKKLAGAKVIHQQFGEAKVKSYTRHTIEIEYENGDRAAYPFPESFQEKTLRYKD